MIETLAVNPELIGSWIVLGGISLGLFKKLRSVGKACRDFAVMQVEKARIDSLGNKTLTYNDVDEYVEASFKFQENVENILKFVYGATISSQSTGWLKAYLPPEEDIKTGIDSAIREMAKVSDSDLSQESIVEQQSEIVSIPVASS